MDDGGYILTVSADEAWMNAEERSFPVAIDPTLFSKSEKAGDGNLYVTYVVEGYPNLTHRNADIHYIGYTANKECWMYANVAKLPDLAPGCVLVDASFVVLQVSNNKNGYSGNTSLQLCAYPVTERPQAGTTYGTWIQEMT